MAAAPAPPLNAAPDPLLRIYEVSIIQIADLDMKMRARQAAIVEWKNNISAMDSQMAQEKAKEKQEIKVRQNCVKDYEQAFKQILFAAHVHLTRASDLLLAVDLIRRGYDGVFSVFQANPLFNFFDFWFAVMGVQLIVL